MQGIIFYNFMPIIRINTSLQESAVGWIITKSQWNCGHIVNQVNCERVFRKLKIIKNRLRASLSNDRLFV